MNLLETELENQKQIAENHGTQMKSKQIEIEGMKVKYSKYKQENEKLST
jgi:hypothetical protein